MSNSRNILRRLNSRFLGIVSITTSILLTTVMSYAAPRKGEGEIKGNYKLSVGTKSVFLNGHNQEELNDFFQKLDDTWSKNKHFVTNFSALTQGYPEHVRGVAYNKQKLWLLMRSGIKILYDDGQKKSASEKIASADLEDSLSMPYIMGKMNTNQTRKEQDPGRIRNDGFFKSIYGKSIIDVTRNLKKIDFCGTKIHFNSRNGAADRLEKVGKEIKQLLSENPEIKPYIEKIGGGFNWRKIAGTKRMSAHSYGIAIDLNPKKGSYWRWYHGDLESFPRNEFPQRIVTIFEKHGFIWGGKWYHFDLMHFEYRPELIHKSILMGNSVAPPYD